MRQLGPRGEAVRGDRVANEVEATVIRGIFRDYVAGKSTHMIALTLKSRGYRRFPGSLGTYDPSMEIRSGVSGILNNELCVGRLIGNRLRDVKDPETGNRVSRLNSERDWVVHDLPDLRIVEQELWDAAKARQSILAYVPQNDGGNPLNDGGRPRPLLSGLIKCGCCGGGFSIISKDLIGCSTARNKGTCRNRLTIRRDALEASVLAGLRSHLMEPWQAFTRTLSMTKLDGRPSKLYAL